MTVSIVIASIVGPPFIDDCIASVQSAMQKLDAETEVIVVVCGPQTAAQRLQERFPWVHVIHRAVRETVPELRRRGVEQAQGDIVAIIEEHCLASPDWLRWAVAAHARGNYGAVGGPVADHAYTRLRDWVVYFCEYNGSLPPAPNTEVSQLNGANIAYRRQTLLDHRHLLGEGYWEVSLHPALLAEGVRFLSVPEMVVAHRGPFDLAYYLRQRYWFSRAFAGARASSLSGRQRLAYVVAAPMIPNLLFLRMSTRVWQKKCHLDKFVQVVPLLIPALIAFVAGEWVGYVLGPGDALSKVE
jgi:glycosyltransferase involved in cell wall biosynthesis